jgi:hypothetical protein
LNRGIWIMRMIVAATWAHPIEPVTGTRPR